MNEINRIDMFVDLAHRGLSFAMQATHIIDWLENTNKLLGKEEEAKSPNLREEERKQALRLEEFANEQVAQGFPYLFTVMTTRLWSVMELLVDEIVAEKLKDSNTWSSPEIIYSIKGGLVEFASLSKDDQADYLALELRRSSHSALKLGVGQFEAMLDIVGCGGSVPDEVRRVLLELQQVRHVSAHRAGLVDRKLLEACPWITCEIGTPIRLSLSHYHVFSAATIWYVMELANRTASPERKEYIQYNKDVQKSTLNTLQGLGSSRWGTDKPESNDAG
jgi:hypothetical protein